MLCWAETLCGFLTICWQAHDHQPERIWGRGIDEPRVRLLLPQSEDLKFKISWTTRTGKQNENICSLANKAFNLIKQFLHCLCVLAGMDASMVKKKTTIKKQIVLGGIFLNLTSVDLRGSWEVWVGLHGNRLVGVVTAEVLIHLKLEHQVVFFNFCLCVSFILKERPHGITSIDHFILSYVHPHHCHLHWVLTWSTVMACRFSS